MDGMNREEPFVVSLWSCSLKSFRPLKKLALPTYSALRPLRLAQLLRRGEHWVVGTVLD